MNFDLNLLPILIAVYETKNVGDAALRLGMSQPGLSTALRRARNALGDPLFLRTSHGMEPTARTRELIDPVRQVMNLVDRKITAPPCFDPSQAKAEFRLAMSDVGEAIYLPPLIRHLSKAAPHVTVLSLPHRRRELELMLEEGKIDLAIGYYPDLKGAEMVEQFIANTSFACIGRIHHPIKAKSLTMEQFCSAPHLSMDSNGRSHEVVEQFLKQHKVQRNVVLRTAHFMSIPSIVADTDLLAIVPSGLAEFLVKQGNFRKFGTPFNMPSFDLKMHWHRTSHHDAKHLWMRKTLLQELRKVVSMGTIASSHIRKPQ